ncbi:DUF4197 domain-containing protein [Reichenbachiella carrageenanivorans]|uniref:DUF4197 domain-containing protein n=1 Tax=Reichenbachiella carrageenanivorans TaxID=2979869 RepID=A0ABY6CXD8_9BACT|nr:DUF4197 domain-containing protein [Reichenbachiella carrageenanivorans]UXX78584.1 DUF4197 domain-containing protein [Reichenbachiella carrageenanivorans]
MMRLTLIAAVVSLSFVFISCDELEDALNQDLSNDDIVAGLKEALDTGIDSAVTSGSAVDGYLKNELIKVLLPEEVKKLQAEIETGSINLAVTSVSYQTILDAYVKTNPKIDNDPFDELVTAMNRGAEQAASKAKPIFVSAIKNMSFTDALNILQGDETAATDYFKSTTSAALITAFQPDIKTALGETAATDIYAGVVSFLNWEYKVSGLIPIEVKVNDYIGKNLDLPESLDEYATTKAVDGLFYLVGEEEKKIRKDPFGYASDIIQKVFSSDEAQGK